MRDTSARMLALLSLLQSRPDWPGPELAARLGVSTRTIRNDVARLRELGYPVDAETGRTGRYRLGIGAGVGAKLPPLLLDDDEAVAIALGLRAGTGLAGTREAGDRALAKLDRVLPHRLRRTLAALTAATDHGPENTGSDAPDPEVDPALLRTLAEAIRDHTALRVADADGPTRLLEPYRLVSWQRRWYLVVRRPDSDRWTVLRVDGLALRTPGGGRFTPVEPPEDLTDLVLREVAASGWSVHARILVHAPATEVLAHINPAVGVVEPRDARTSVLVTGADSPATLAAYIGMLDMDFEVDGPPEVVAQLRTTGERYLRAVGG